MKKKYALLQILLLALVLLACRDNSLNTDIKLTKLYVSYFPSRSNYDIDSILICKTNEILIDTIMMDFREDYKYKHLHTDVAQKLTSQDQIIFENVKFNGAVKPFVWADSRVNNFDVSIDSVRRYLKQFIIQENTFILFSKSTGYQRLILKDTSAIELKELNGSLDLVD